MNFNDIIEKKKLNIQLSKAEIYYIVNKFLDGTIQDYQMSAFLMAVYFTNMTEEETFNLTCAIIESGDSIDLSAISKMTVDKHSTGGVGDKVSLILAPLLATFDLAVAKMSGRGLGHTGGTLDKLESISGFNINLSNEQFINVVNECGVSIISQNANLVPADKMLYALRDVTGTINSIPLITSSIMSKKIASGAKIIILDVKYGDGAFMKTKSEAIELANSLVKVGKKFGRKTIAVVSSMKQPLGSMVGNSLEILEVVDVLNNKGPEDITKLTKELATEILVSAEIAHTHKQALQMIDNKLQNGHAKDKFIDFIKAQGAAENVLQTLKVATDITPVVATETGYISEVKADLVGKVAMQLGAGRKEYTDIIDHSVGVEVKVKIGDFVQVGDVLFNIYSHIANDVNNEVELLHNCITYSENAPLRTTIIEKVIK